MQKNAVRSSGSMHRRTGWIRSLLIMGLSAAFVPCAHADQTYQYGKISNITMGQDTLLIMLDSGAPTNCAGVSFGWMTIPANAKTMQAFVLGLWLRGDANQTNVTVYTAGNVNGACIINQLDPEG